MLRLRRAPVELTLVDRRNFHLFQPLTYQVATGALAPGEIAYPLRAIFKRSRNVRVLLAEASDIDLARRRLELRSVPDASVAVSVPYDTLILAGGSRYSYFGHDEWSEHAAEVKSLESALTVRARILSAFEAAEMEQDPARRAAWLTFVVVGAGPTGVEMAGQIGELARDTLRRDFRSIDPRNGRILLIEAAERMLTSFPASLSARAERSLAALGVTAMLGQRVVGVDAAGVSVAGRDGDTERIAARTVVWAAGVTASALASRLAELTGAELDRAGRVTVEVTQNDGSAVISVADDGPGIPINERQNVFKRFYRLERSRRTPGNGLGLSLVAAVARLHGAGIEMMDNAPGLKFRLRFPSPARS